MGRLQSVPGTVQLSQSPAVPLIFGVGFGVFFQKIAEQVVVGVDVRVFF